MSVVLKFVRELGPYKLAAGIGGLLLLLLLIIGATLNMSSRNMAVLYSDLENTDSNQIVQELEAKNVPYEVVAGGSIIKVPQDRVLKLRMFMAQEGLPTRGSIVGYEIFDKEEALGTTNFMQNVKLVRALEGEISRTIASFDQVDKVRVHLVIPQREIFSRERQDPRASIAIKLRGNKPLGKNEINSISHLTATAVPGLDVKNITIVDTKGRPLKLSAGEDDEYGAGGSSQEQKLAFEMAMKKRLEDLLAQTLGAGKATVQVVADLNFDRIVSNSETFDPDGAVVRSTQSVEESEKTPVGDQDSLDVSVANNLPGGGSEAGDSSAFATSVKRDETTNYEISKIVQNKISESGTVSHLSVAVVVDGHYNTNAETGVVSYEPRSKEEMTQIDSLIKTAVGYQEKRDDQVRVVNMQFTTDLETLEQDDTNAWLREELPSLLQTLILAVVVTLIVIMVIRPIALRAFDRTSSDQLADFGLSGGNKVEKAATFAEAKEAGTPPAVKKINDVIASYPQETMIVLRKWLNK